MKHLLVAALAAAGALALVGPAAASEPAGSLGMWAKIRSAWTSQAKAAGKSIVCEDPVVVRSTRTFGTFWVWTGGGTCTATGRGRPTRGWVLPVDYKKACRYQVGVTGIRQMATIDRCRPGWLATLPRLR